MGMGSSFSSKLFLIAITIGGSGLGDVLRLIQPGPPLESNSGEI
jgi:hypothetical protein